MAVAVVADAHLGGPGGPPGPLIRQLEELPARGCRHLVLLGDLFQIWIGDRRFEVPGIRETVSTLRSLRQGGVRIDYIEGNRDFFLAGSVYEEAFDRLGSEIEFTADGRRFLAVHGDGLDRRDRMYRFWRALSKSAVSRSFVRRLPRRLARRAVESTERRLARTNIEHKVRIPEAALRSYGARRLQEGHDVLLLGHFHEARRWRVEGGEILLLDAWFRSRRVEWFGSPG